MYYVVYMDVFFLLNFWIDLFLIFLMRYIVKQYRTVCCLFAAAVGAALATVLLLLYLKGAPAFLLPFGGFLSMILMNRIAYGRVKLFWHCLMFTIVGAVFSAIFSSALYGLSMLGVKQSEGTELFSVLIVCVTAFAGCILFEKQSRIAWKEEHMKAKTILEFGDRKVLATALMDTGNRLYDPFYHKPVILVDESILKELIIYCKTQKPEKLQYIPFHSVGKENGMLEGMMFERVSIQWQEKTWQFSDVIAASSKTSLYNGKEYQVIFHCGLLNEAA